MDFSLLAEVFERIEATRKRLEYTKELAKLFAAAKPSEVRRLAYLCNGILLPQHEGIDLGVGDKLAEQSISLVSGKSVKEVETVFRRKGDLGEAAQELLHKKTQLTLSAHALSLEKVYDNLMRVATASGVGSQETKVKLLAELLSNASPNEARVIVRLVQGSLRMGVGESTVLDTLSVAKAGDKSLREELERAFNLTSDIGLVAESFFEKGIDGVRKVKPIPFNPIRPALAGRLPGAKEIFEKLGECAAEGKYDGLRLAIHKSGERVEIFSRKQEKMTHMFPDVVTAVRKQVRAREAIFEGEAVAFDECTKRFLPFQETIQRKRKHGVGAKAKELPLHVFAFELLYCDGKDLTRLPYSERRAELAAVIKQGETIELAKNIIAKSALALKSFFDECVSAGLEGIIAKDLSAPYTAGTRKFAWIKLKKSYQTELADSLDLTIVGYYIGKGKRTQFGFGGLLAAAYGPRENSFRTVCKIGTGFSEERMKEFKQMLSEIEVAKKPDNVDSVLVPSKWVKPRYVVSVTADEITQSPTHTCCRKGNQGLALRFPRFKELRTDKNPEDATTEDEVMELYEMQGQKNG
ncbi:TPA: ATP-dependent DNA ligase [Candidatus Micrarchaeota archaeon]|nr:MAG: hypothetical protein AUJ65_04510 [Candidatus Micrarchaeota archaeon CG1_02_51_15]HII38995.1 ATP-dependent DNA ligase [Candidatus Micrarchaeota archaeon]